ncbi:hypothetical protein GCM10025867_40280 [Frondihabitans sucicola]|uniref:Glutaredoxin family protein n=1 Tax=Frondihabitans sucicola TaxID=1268041 RepID=A0ABN6Y381_9MICO|nr:hypothetical protein GCM10025867_40280 [Frondihabitans sucicola]
MLGVAPALSGCDGDSGREIAVWPRHRRHRQPPRHRRDRQAHSRPQRDSAGGGGAQYSGGVPVPHITLLTKPGCHLCDDAREALEAVLDEVEFAGARDYDELSILDDQSLADEYSEEIPVVLIDGRVHTIWRVEPDRLRTALRAAAPHPPHGA